VLDETPRFHHLPCGAAAAGWLAAVGTALIAGALLGIPKLPVLLASGALWTCLLLLE
jgi:hypothetical protein